MQSRCLLIVNYHSSELTRTAVGSARLASSGTLRIVIVDNSESDDEHRALLTIDRAEVLRAPRNLGYAGGINLGLGVSHEDVVIAANPDVVFRPHCIDRLVEQLGGPVALTGPACTWDSRDEWLLPLPRTATRRERVSDVLASRNRFFGAWSERRAIGKRVTLWRAQEPVDVPVVSGAVMAFRRDLVDAIGGLDENFTMYFEEIDLMRRLRAGGWRVRYVPGAVCQHYFAQTGGNEDRERLFAESQEKFDRKWLGAGFAHVTSRLIAAKLARDGISPLSIDTAVPVPGRLEEHLIEASPLASFESAAGHFPTTPAVRFPRDVYRRLRAPDLFLRVVYLPARRVIAVYRVAESVQ